MKVKAVLAGCAIRRDADRGFFAIEPGEQPGTSTFHVLLDDEWHGYDEKPGWLVIGMASAHYDGDRDWVVLATSSEGDIWELSPASAEERILKISEDVSDLTRLRAIRSQIYACGMGRVVWCRNITGDWEDISAPDAPREDEEAVIGFTDMAGATQTSLVAVGWNGDIWFREGGEWRSEESGSNANFNAVSVAPDGKIVIVGDDGALVTGWRSEWSVVDTGLAFNLQGVCHFGGEVFVCSDLEIFRLEGDLLVPEDRFDADERPRTCLQFVVGVDTLFCQGERSLFQFQNGVWKQII